MVLTVSDLNEDRGAGEGALSSPSISEFTPLGLSSGFHRAAFGVSHHPSQCWETVKKKSIGLVTPRAEPKTASVAAALLLPSLAPASAMLFHPQGSRPVPWGGVGLSLGLQPAACRVHGPH